MVKQGGLKSALGLESISVIPPPEPIEEKLKRLIHLAPVMIFIKGTPSATQCGFSHSIVEILDEESITYGHFNILSDEEVRQQLKVFSDWPTYPQVYVKGELVGGLDIIREMRANGNGP